MHIHTDGPGRQHTTSQEEQASRGPDFQSGGANGAQCVECRIIRLTNRIMREYATKSDHSADEPYSVCGPRKRF